MPAPPTTGALTRADYLAAVEAAAFAEVVTFDVCTQLLHTLHELRRVAPGAAPGPRLMMAVREEMRRLNRLAEQRTAHNRAQLLAFDEQHQDVTA